jgi:hypothetical protein
VLSLVRDDLGLGEITGTYGSERGQPPFDPTMMTALLLYSGLLQIEWVIFVILRAIPVCDGDSIADW